MNRLLVTLLALPLLLCPIFAALPDDTTLPQTAWASLLSAFVMAGVLVAVVQTRKVFPSGAKAAVTAYAALLGLGLLSGVARVVTHHSTAYAGLMLRGWAVLATEFALLTLCRSLARTRRSALYALLGAVVIGSTVLSSIGVNEYLLHFVAHQPSWRVFATSTPDFLAGYLVLLLPVTLALFLGAPSEKRLPLLFGLIIVLQMASLLTSGSRFALVSLMVAFAVFAATLAYAVRHGLTLDGALRQRLLAIMVVVVLAGLMAARPILNRLNSGASQGNSGAFRLWTWRGAAHMAAANPVLGTGIGTWIDTYPRYALTGFTRLAHNSYLQMADECGLPALLALVATLGLVGAAGARGLKTALVATAPSSAEEPPPMRTSGRGRGQNAPTTVAAPAALAPLSFVAPADDRLLLCGLLASLAAGVVQNLIDSDWYVFFIGITFWAIAGLAVGVTERGGGEAPVSAQRKWTIPVGVVAALLLLGFVGEGMGAWFGYQAQTADDPGAARADYDTAQAWNPLSARYPAELGARVEARTGDLPAAEASLRRATRLEPSSTNFRRLGTVLDSADKRDEAAAAYADGLHVDPNSLDLLLALAKDSPPVQALALYRRIADLEDSPVGRVRAIGEITEARFAIADAALGNASKGGLTPETIRYDERAQKLLEAYIDEGGTMNSERQVQSGSHPDPTQDTQFRDLYTQVMTDLATAAASADRKAVIEDRARNFRARFQAVIDTGMGDTASATDDAAADYQRAAAELEKYATAAKTPTTPLDPAGNAQMQDLYKHVMERLAALTPADQQAALQARARAGLQKFAESFPAR